MTCKREGYLAPEAEVYYVSPNRDILVDSLICQPAENIETTGETNEVEW